MRCDEVRRQLPFYLQCIEQHGQAFADATYIGLRVHLDNSIIDRVSSIYSCGCYPEYQRLLRESRPLQPVVLRSVKVVQERTAKPMKLRYRVAMLCGLSSSQKSPVDACAGFASGSNKKSGMPPTGVAMTGIPAAIASKNELPSPSERDGRINISEILRYFGISL